MKAKKVLSLLMALLTVTSSMIVTANADTNYSIGYWNIVHANRYLTFATEGGSYINELELPCGTVVNVNEYIPMKDGYIFDGWYADPRTKVERVDKVTLTENIVVYAKWIDDRTVEIQSDEVVERKVTENTVVFHTSSGVVETPVTELWVQQNNRLEELMRIYNEIFND